MLDLNKTALLKITCARGLSPYLAQEVRDLGFRVEAEHPTWVELQGSFLDAMRLNLELWTAFHVLYRLKDFACFSPDDLYHEVKDLPWERMLPLESLLSVVSRVDTESVNNSMFPNLKVKDAVVDRMSEKLGDRPNTGPSREGAVLTLHWKGERAQLYWDTSGTKLSDRGYRRRPHKAPLRESLAAGILRGAGYDGTRPLISPMCGSGTLAIEAALWASGRSPGLLRSHYGLLHLKLEQSPWRALREELGRRPRKKPAPIVASDIDARAVEAARSNAQTAGVSHLIDFHCCDFAETPLPEDPGTVVFNPSYGERLEGGVALEKLYGRIGDFFKQRCGGGTGLLFTSNRELAKKVGLRTKRRLPFFNGQLECRLLRYELYKGSKKARKATPQEPQES